MNLLIIDMAKRNPPSPGVAAVLSFFIPGLGIIYAGNITKGLLVLLGTVVAFFIPLINIVVWIWQIYYTYKTAEAMN